MRYRFADDVEPRLAALLESAQREPVFIDRAPQGNAVLLSTREYDRLSGEANLDFQKFCDEVSDRALDKGLTEARLNDLLDHA